MKLFRFHRIFPGPLHVPRRDPKTGATMVEAALVLPLFLLLCLVFFEFVRIVIAQAVATYAALVAVKVASGAEVAVTTTPGACSLPSNPCTMYLLEWDRAISEAESVARLVASSSSVASGLQLVAVDHYDSAFAPDHGHLASYNSGGAVSLTRDVMLLRPGERGRYNYSTGPEIFDHQIRAYGPTNTLSVGWPANSLGEDWADVLETIPLLSRVVMIYTPVVPGMPSLRIVGQQLGNVRVKTGGLPQPPASASPTPSNSPSASPSLTPSPSVSPSPPAPSQSPSQTPSPPAPSQSPSQTPSPPAPSQSPSMTPSPVSPSPTQSPVSPSPTPTASSSPESPSPTGSPSSSPPAPSPSASESPPPPQCLVPGCNLQIGTPECNQMIAICTTANGLCPCPGCGCCPYCPAS